MNVQPRDTSATQNSSSSNNLLGGGNDQFMQLLMTQLEAQDPLSPMDTNSFVSQLVQFNTLDQVTQIRDLIESLGSSMPSGS